MTTPEILERIERAFAEALTSPFRNFHGITPANLPRYRVPPREVDVLDDEGGSCTMWLVLEQRVSADLGYAVAFDPGAGVWAVVEPMGTWDGASRFMHVVQADSLAGALDSM